MAITVDFEKDAYIPDGVKAALIAGTYTDDVAQYLTPGFAAAGIGGRCVLPPWSMRLDDPVVYLSKQDIFGSRLGTTFACAGYGFVSYEWANNLIPQPHAEFAKMSFTGTTAAGILCYGYNSRFSKLNSTGIPAIEFTIVRADATEAPGGATQNHHVDDVRVQDSAGGIVAFSAITDIMLEHLTLGNCSTADVAAIHLVNGGGLHLDSCKMDENSGKALYIGKGINMLIEGCNIACNFTTMPTGVTRVGVDIQVGAFGGLDMLGCTTRCNGTDPTQTYRMVQIDNHLGGGLYSCNTHWLNAALTAADVKGVMLTNPALLNMDAVGNNFRPAYSRPQYGNLPWRLRPASDTY